SLAHLASREGGGRDRWLSSRPADGRDAEPVPDPSLEGGLARARAVRPRSIHRRTFGRQAPLRLLSLRRRSTTVHRQRVRSDRGDARARDHTPPLPTRARVPARGRPSTTHNAPPARPAP